MTSTPSHQAGNSRRDQLIAALVVGGVLVALGAASGLGIELTSSAAPLSQALPTKAGTLALSQPSTTRSSPVNYIGSPGPGNLPTVQPGGVLVPSVVASTPARSSDTPNGAVTSTGSASPTRTDSPTWPTLSCPSDVVTGLLDVLRSDKGLLSSAGLLRTVLNLLPELANLLHGVGQSSVLSTDVGNLSVAQTSSLAQACAPPLAGLLGGGGG